jgi:hypothetical protein
MESNVEKLVVGLYLSLLRDFQYMSPTMDKECKMAESRLHSITASRGIGFFTITLPDACKYLERGLADGRLGDDRPPYHGGRSKTDVRPTFLWGLYAMIFDEHGLLRPDSSEEAVAALRQLYLFAKKLRLDCAEDKVNESLIEFLEIDKNLPPSHSGTWDYDTPTWSDRVGHPLWNIVPNPDGQFDLGLDQDLSVPDIRLDLRWDAFRILCRFVSSTFGPIDVWSMRPKHGPGAVADSTKVKYELPHWPAKLARVFPADWFASTDMVDRTSSVMEHPSRIITVPKTQKGPRIIAAEPTAHQFIQGAFQRWFVTAIGRSVLADSIDFFDQKPSQRLALQASMSGELATVDLSAASDRISTRLVEYIFQSNLDVLDVLHSCRTRTFQMPDGSVHVTRKFACMGSASTFPVQTYLFTLIAIFAIMMAENDYKVTETRVREIARRVRVFGDDIILPANAYDSLYLLLTQLGLKVNPHKSFWTGKFRESCGMDAYNGVDVTPAYFLEGYESGNPESLVSLVECSNNFHRKGCWNASAYLLNTVDSKIRKNLRIANRDVSQPYLYSYAPGETSLKQRQSPDTHSPQVLQLVVSSKTQLLKGTGNASLLQYFTEAPDPYFPYESGTPKRPSARLSRRWVAL